VRLRADRRLTPLAASGTRASRAVQGDRPTRVNQKPESGRIAVKVINHLGDEVMKVFKA
jgi:adenine-specific DNA-methyltransferase